MYPSFNPSQLFSKQGMYCSVVVLNCRVYKHGHLYDLWAPSSAHQSAKFQLTLSLLLCLYVTSSNDKRSDPGSNSVHFSSDHLSVCPASTFADKKLKSRKEGAASGIKDPSNDRVPCTDFDVTLTGKYQILTPYVECSSWPSNAFPRTEWPLPGHS